MDKVVKTFRTVAQVPSITGGKILKNEGRKLNKITVYSSWSQRCLERGKSVKIQLTHIVDFSSRDSITLVPLDSSTEQVTYFFTIYLENSIKD